MCILRETANAVCARRHGPGSSNKLERNLGNNSLGVLSAGTCAQPKQASQSKYSDKIRLIHVFSFVEMFLNCSLLTTWLARFYSTYIRAPLINCFYNVCGVRRGGQRRDASGMSFDCQVVVELLSGQRVKGRLFANNRTRGSNFHPKKVELSGSAPLTFTRISARRTISRWSSEKAICVQLSFQ